MRGAAARAVRPCASATMISVSAIPDRPETMAVPFIATTVSVELELHEERPRDDDDPVAAAPDGREIEGFFDALPSVGVAEPLEMIAELPAVGVVGLPDLVLAVLQPEADTRAPRLAVADFFAFVVEIVVGDHAFGTFVRADS